MLRIISFSTTNVTIARDGFFFFIRHAILDFGEGGSAKSQSIISGRNTQMSWM